MPKVETRITRLDERIPKPRPGCRTCRQYPERRQCDAVTCTSPDRCPVCGRAITYRFERRYRGVSLSDI